MRILGAEKEASNSPVPLGKPLNGQEGGNLPLKCASSLPTEFNLISAVNIFGNMGYISVAEAP